MIRISSRCAPERAVAHAASLPDEASLRDRSGNPTTEKCANYAVPPNHHIETIGHHPALNGSGIP
ncbi:uncharacterized protein THITE_2112454 [Thermothielavioides terrestris NRRL 8126]|uniref:Uncharacterized protein n=1 Tax=Thermothielavioides terrestris (strain ATCC 38088 / NRRL 8126) TaxID=578455 RepID=G2QZ21_THETT|nr:uncharacterized protein THITE_2112454 [Thermothielavioides terrestris NRRL 8126]AEO65453.1 hypothetical protein THITE_2112454 [Thermothielavioides terrestris NRRL 8126]